MDDASLEDADLLTLIVAFFTKPATKGVTITSKEVQCSTQLRKAMAVFSFESVPTGEGANLKERGVKPSLRQIREKVEAVGGRWPWPPTSDSALGVLRRARTDYLAKKFDDVDLSRSRCFRCVNR